MYVCVHVYTNTFILMNENYSFCIILILCMFSELAIRNRTKNMCTLSWGRPIHFCFALKFPRFPIVFCVCLCVGLSFYEYFQVHFDTSIPVVLLWLTVWGCLWYYYGTYYHSNSPDLLGVTTLSPPLSSMFSELYVQKCFIDKLTSTVQHNSAFWLVVVLFNVLCWKKKLL